MTRLRAGRLPFIASVFIAATLLSPASSAPVVLAVRGDARDGASLALRGVGFGVKKPAAPLLWADFSSSLKPSKWGRFGRWDAVQNIVWTRVCEGRSGCAVASNPSGSWTLGLDHHAWSKESARTYVFKKIRTNFRIENESQNWKTWRLWPASGSYPNLYVSPSNGRVYVEGVGEESGFWGPIQPDFSRWSSEELFLRASSMPNKKDGRLRIRYNGVEAVDGTVMTRSAKAPAYMVRNYVVHGVAANKKRWKPPWRDENRIWVDDVYVDDTWARVMIGNQPTLAGSSRWEIQVPVSWSDESIEVRFNAGAFQSGAPAFLYVFDEAGVANFRGYPLTIGAPVR